MTGVLCMAGSCTALLASSPHYYPSGHSAEVVDGKARFNRPLYSPTHSGFRMECSDTPEFGLYNPRMGGNLLITLPKGECTTRYIPGSMVYRQGGMEVTAIMAPDSNVALWAITNTTSTPKEISLRFGGATDRRYSREGDLGVDPPDCFDFTPERCKGNVYDIKGGHAVVTYGVKTPVKASIIFPGNKISVTELPSIEQTTTVAPGETVYVAYTPGEADYSQQALASMAKQAETTRSNLANSLVIETPDPMLNPVGEALAMAGNGIWSGQYWLHGAVGWRTPHLGWRGAYAGDVLGWYDRAHTHFDSYASNQITDIPATLQHPRQDSTLNLARAEKRWGTPMYSNGYICRRPGHKDEMSHYDMNMVYVDALLRHLRHTGDKEEMRRFFPVIKSHLAWEKLNFDPDGDFLYDGYACIWASDALFYSGGAATHSTACHMFANMLAAQVAEQIGEDPEPFRKEADGIRKALEDNLWIDDKGYWAECRDLMGHGRLHTNPGLWTIYHAIDSETTDPFKAYAATCYVDNAIPHINVGDGLFTISTTNWKPYSWSINNVAIAEVMHMALAYWQAGRPEEAYDLMQAVMKDNMYDGACPLNFGQISNYDAARGECYRDFADPVGVWSRALTEGLFGIIPDMLSSDPHVLIRPGFPSDWDNASFRRGDIAYTFERKGDRTIYHIENSSRKDTPVWLEIPVDSRYKVTVNGHDENAIPLADAIGRPKIKIILSGSDKYDVEITAGQPLAGEKTGKTRKEGNVSFTEMKSGQLTWWIPEVTGSYKKEYPISDGFDDVQPTLCRTVDISGLCNDSVSAIFRNRYLSPRPSVTTLQIPVQGIGEWCHPTMTADIDDSGLRDKLRASDGIIEGPGKMPLQIPYNGDNVIYTSLWDNYPAYADVPLSGKASHIYLVLAGSTNHMQYDIENGKITVTYDNGSPTITPIVNPLNYAPIEQDFYNDGGAFSLPDGMKSPMRLHLASGISSRALGDSLGITGVTPRTIPGGAAVVIDIPVDSLRNLRNLRLETLSNDVVIGLMGVTLQNPRTPADWYPVAAENRPGVRWWWHGSAVDPEGLDFNMQEFADKGIGAVEITPIYGVQGNEANDIPYLSDKWMDMLAHVERKGQELDVRVDMNNGTGWPFGGPNVTTEESARKLLVDTFTLKAGEHHKILPPDEKQRSFATLQRVMAYGPKGVQDITSRMTPDSMISLPKGMKSAKVYALFSGRTMQKVKRAAPGGEGLVVNHLDSNYVKKYLARFDEAFSRTGVKYPASFFNDSYEVYGADWDDRLLDNFFADHGYRLEDHIDVYLGEGDDEFRSRLLRDYRWTLGRMLEENFTLPWLRWAHSHGATVRNQSHGSPANIIDLYADVDIAECESFGQSDFNIPGLVETGPSRHSDAEPAVLKFASSATNLTGKPYTSAEALTWLTEHFRTSLARCKPELDMMFTSGVNRLFFHGAAYSPANAPFPGRHFYAAVDMSPTNSLWPHAGELFDYVAKVQSFLTKGEPDNDFLLYFPHEDIMHGNTGKRYLMFDIHGMDRTMPEVKQAVRDIVAAGYDLDYISDRLLKNVSVGEDKKLNSEGGATGYKAIIIPGARYVPLETLKKLDLIARDGGKVIFVGRYPESLPGNVKDKTPKEFLNLVESLRKNSYLAKDMKDALAMSGAAPETIKRDLGLNVLRRKSDVPGYNYFIAHTGEKPVDTEVELSVPSKSVLLFDPVTGRKGRVSSVSTPDGKTRFRLQLNPGETLLVKALEEDVPADSWVYLEPAGNPLPLSGEWNLKFLRSEPAVDGEFTLESVGTWTDLPDPNVKVNSGTALYTTEVDVPSMVEASDWILDLGDVREVAVVRVNGHDAGTAWSVPFRLNVGEWIVPGKNKIEIEVTSLDANRIADWERRGVKWRVFKDANIASVTGAKTFSFGDWDLVPNGLNSEVKLLPMKRSN